MKKKYSIGFLLVNIILISIILFPVKTNSPESSTNESVSSMTTNGDATKENCYYLYEVNGYVVVYLNDQKTPYEYTDILYSDLPTLLQQEIKNGKYIKNEEELYGFLENYSS